MKALVLFGSYASKAMIAEIKPDEEKKHKFYYEKELFNLENTSKLNHLLDEIFGDKILIGEDEVYPINGYATLLTYDQEKELINGYYKINNEEWNKFEKECIEFITCSPYEVTDRLEKLQRYEMGGSICYSHQKRYDELLRVINKRDKHIENEAKKSGKPVLSTAFMKPCTTSSEECNYDVCAEYVNPDGSLKKTTEHLN